MGTCFLGSPALDRSKGQIVDDFFPDSRDVTRWFQMVQDGFRATSGSSVLGRALYRLLFWKRLLRCFLLEVAVADPTGLDTELIVARQQVACEVQEPFGAYIRVVLCWFVLCVLHWRWFKVLCKTCLPTRLGPGCLRGLWAANWLHEGRGSWYRAQCGRLIIYSDVFSPSIIFNWTTLRWHGHLIFVRSKVKIVAFSRMAVSCQNLWRKDCETRLKVGRFLAQTELNDYKILHNSRWTQFHLCFRLSFISYYFIYYRSTSIISCINYIFAKPLGSCQWKV